MSSKAFTRETFVWLHQVSRGAIASKGRGAMAALPVALQLTTHFNEEEGGRAWPSYKTIGAAIGLPEQTVFDAVRWLHKNGDLRVEWGKRGRGHPNHYRMIVKPSAGWVLEGNKTQPSASENPAPAGRTFLKNHQTRKSVSGGERPAAAGGGSQELTPPSAAGRGSAPSDNADYRVLRAAWPRPWEDDDAADRRAYAAALKVATHDVILAGAIARAKAVRERNKDKGDDWVSFLPTLAKWLRARGWANPLPKRAKDQHARRGRQRSSGDELSDRMRLAGGWTRDADGAWIKPDDEEGEWGTLQ